MRDHVGQTPGCGSLIGSHDSTVVYLYNGQKTGETRNGSGNMAQQFLHGDP